MTLRKMIPAATAMLLGLAPGSAQAAEEPPHRHVSVSGQGEVTVQPDRARVHIGVTQLNVNLSTAEAEVNKIVRAFLAEAKALGIKDEHVNSSGISIQPEYVWDEKERANRLVGYRVSRDIQVLVLKLDQLGDVVLRATKVGVNQVQAPLLEYSKAQDIQRQALVKAAQDAQARAKLLAETLGMKLGAVHQISASDSGPPPPMPKVMMRASMAADGGGNQEMGLSPGELRYSASVQADFELIAP